MPTLPSPISGVKQRGVALLTVLLMVVVASIMATGILNYEQRLIRENSILLRQDQAWAYAKSGEYFLSELLVEDAKNINKNDNLSEQWAQPMPVYPIEDGSITGQIIDMSGKFNLNNLYHDGKRDDKAVAYFSRLLKRIGLAPELADAVVDWQDPDNDITGSFGAEDSFYMGQQHPYLTANRPFQQVGELQQVRGFNAASVAKLAPYISALPAFSPINVNTAPALVLTALDDTLNPDVVKQWVEQRDQTKQYLDQADGLWATDAFKSLNPAQRSAVAPLLATRSSFFKAEITVSLSGRQRYLNSELYRQGQQVMAYSRSMLPVVTSSKKNSSQQILQQLLSTASQ